MPKQLLHPAAYFVIRALHIYISVKPCPSQNSLCSTSIYGHPMHSSICSTRIATLPIFICFSSSTLLFVLRWLLHNVVLASSVNMHFFHAYHLSFVNGSFAFHLFRSSGCSSSWQLWHRLTRLRLPSLSYISSAIDGKSFK